MVPLDFAVGKESSGYYGQLRKQTDGSLAARRMDSVTIAMRALLEDPKGQMMDRLSRRKICLWGSWESKTS